MKERIRKTIEITQSGRAHFDDALNDLAAKLDEEFSESPRATLHLVIVEKYYTRSAGDAAHFTYMFDCEGWPNDQ